MNERRLQLRLRMRTPPHKNDGFYAGFNCKLFQNSSWAKLVYHRSRLRQIESFHFIVFLYVFEKGPF